MYPYFFGMNLLWWIFWGLAIVAFWALLTPVPRSRVTRPADPIDILRRRYAAGELTTAEFDERLARLRGTGSSGTRTPEGPVHDLPPTARPPAESTVHH